MSGISKLFQPTTDRKVTSYECIACNWGEGAVRSLAYCPIYWWTAFDLQQLVIRVTDGQLAHQATLILNSSVNPTGHSMSTDFPIDECVYNVQTDVWRRTK